MLRTMVAAGEILPLEMRLPKEPLVINPLEEIGQYDETMHLTTPESPSDWYFNSYWLHQAPIQLTSDLEEIYPNYLKGFQEGISQMMKGVVSCEAQ